MPPDSHLGEQSVHELGRQLREALNRIEGLTTRLDMYYVRKDLFESNERTHDVIHKDLRQDVDQLLDDKKWLIRLVGGIIILALIGLLIVTNGTAKP